MSEHEPPGYLETTRSEPESLSSAHDMRSRWSATLQALPFVRAFPAYDAYLCGMLMLVGGLMRFWRLTYQSLWIDESSTLILAYSTVPNLIKNTLALDTHPPLYYLVVHFAYYVFGLPPIYALRMPSLLCGTLTIGIMYGLGRLLVGRFAGIVAATLTALSPIAIWYSRDGRMYAMTWCFVLLSYLLLVLVIQRGRWYWVAGYSIAVVLALYADISAILGILPQAFVILWALTWAMIAGGTPDGPRAAERARPWFHALLGFAGGWLLFVPWLLLLPQQLTLIRSIHFGALTFGQIWLLMLNDLGLAANYAFLDTTTPPIMTLASLLAFAGAAVVSVWAARLPRYRLYGRVVAPLTLGSAGIFAILLVAGSRAVLIPRVVGIVSFGFILLAAGAVGILAEDGILSRLWGDTSSASFAVEKMAPLRAWATTWGTRLVVTVGLLVILVVGTDTALARVEADGSNYSHWNTIAAAIERQAQPNDVIIYYPLGIKYIIDPYLPANSPWRSAAKGLWPQAGHSPEPYFQQNIPGHAHVWFLFYWSSQVNMPLYDTWIQQMGYCREEGDPQARFGLMKYRQCAPPT
jgi:dolichyl-phosphate-mannose-protein mannosyltransferase